ncbi:MAG: hypothetical protein A3F11_06845 [Gammaproteobacteria bacterium RIFCSPHIGHO2_12_FULL_37_14]|nr:MAG: hypothetical protein A3F11_06845 [Gammaproteobacteria bacterium RIFCSPHIGHO2_12_FULL_37_14]
MSDNQDNRPDKLIADFEKAIYNHELILYYQPQYNLNTLLCEGVEALIRWQHPQKGLIQPDEFIRFIERNDIILQMGEWVLLKACQQCKEWQQKGFKPIRMAVNVSEKQFRQKNFVSKVSQILQECELDPSYLELELLENVVINENDEKLIETIWELKRLGVLITLDDFCTGYSKINYLTKIPVDRIKIDKSYIKNLHPQSNDEVFVRAIIEMANRLKIQVLAEGVESLEQLKILSSQQCHQIQGFYFSEPLPAEKIEKLFLS